MSSLILIDLVHLHGHLESYLDPLLKKYGAQAAYAREILIVNEATNLDQTSIGTLLREHDLIGDDGYDPFPKDDVMIDGGMQAFVTSLAKKVKGKELLPKQIGRASCRERV